MNLTNGDSPQAKASLFAAGCFCELSDDFAFVLLEILVNMLSSPEIAMGIRLAGARALAKMGRSYSLASKAFKVLFYICCFFSSHIRVNKWIVYREPLWNFLDVMAGLNKLMTGLNKL